MMHRVCAVQNQRVTKSSSLSLNSFGKGIAWNKINWENFEE